MRVTELSLTSFRNCAACELAPAAGVTVLVGPNAAGKTNILEALCLLTRGESFRRAEWRDLVRWGDEGARARMEAEGPDARIGTALTIGLSGAREWTVNGKPKRSGSALAGLVPSVVFTPDDLTLVKGPAGARRAEADSLGALIWEAYGKAARDYERVLRQRNALLKAERWAPAELDAWDERLAETGGRLTAYRGRLLAKLAGPARESLLGLSGEQLELGYEDRAGLGPAVPEGIEPEAAAEAIRRAPETRRTEEAARRVSLVGPHRDDIVFSIERRDARALASQGQQRSAVLAWKLAEVAVVREVTGKAPVVLLDDVMSELDESRRKALTGLASSGNQTFVTTTNLGYFSEELLADALVVKVGPGG